MARYEAWQLQRLRDGLKAFQALGLDRGGQAFSWPAIEEAIYDETGIRVPHGRLAKFVIGEPHRDPVRKAKGERYYPALSAERAEAIVAFLTNPESTGYVMRPSALHIYPRGLEAPVALMDYLNPEGAARRYTAASSLAGVFIAWPGTEDSELSLCIRFRDMGYQALVPFALTEHRGGPPVLPEEYEDRAADLPKGRLCRARGWALLTPEENILLLGRYEGGGSVIYVSVGIDRAVYEDKPASAFVLQRHSMPEDGVDLTAPGGERRLMEAVAAATKEGTFLFRRGSPVRCATAAMDADSADMISRRRHAM